MKFKILKIPEVELNFKTFLNRHFSEATTTSIYGEFLTTPKEEFSLYLNEFHPLKESLTHLQNHIYYNESEDIFLLESKIFNRDDFIDIYVELINSDMTICEAVPDRYDQLIWEDGWDIVV